MSIHADKKKVSVDFDYGQEKEDGHIGFNISVRLHYTDEYGKTLSFSTDGVEYIGLPVKFFSEVVDFLRKEGYLDKPEAEKQDVVSVMPAVKPLVVQTTKLPLPFVGHKDQESVSAPRSDMETLNRSPVNEQPLQSFYPTKGETPPTFVKDASNDEGEAEVVAGHHTVSKEEVEALKLEREKAKRKQTDASGIRRAHKTAEDK